jgi:DNA-binding response OmpR family regulator
MNVLIVDDEMALGMALQRLLSRRGWTVVFESDGLRALRRLKTESFDAVIADERMPGPGGAFLLEEVKRRSPTTRLVMLSGDPSDLGRERVEAIGGVVLMKGGPAILLLEAIGG